MVRVSLANWFSTMPHPNLTPIQQSVWGLIVAGKSNAEIARAMGWGVATATARVSEVLKAMGIEGGRRGLMKRL